MKTTRSAGISVIVVLILGLTLTTWHGSTAAITQTLQASGSLRWYRGNLHTHSLWSDGDDYPEMIALWYRDRDYDFLVFTDHNTLHHSDRWTDVDKNKGGRPAYDELKQQFADSDWVEERTVDGKTEVRLRRFDEVSRLVNRDNFLLIQGEEITDRFRNLPIHMNATNIQSMIPPLGGDSVYDVMQNNVNAVTAQRERTGEPILVHLNHPNFGYGVTAEDLLRVRGENFFEVYNGHPGVHNSGDSQHASCDRIWDIILTKRLAELGMPVMYGLATDDGHNYHTIPSRASEPGRGWVQVLADSLQPGSLIEALEAGRFYSSSGVEFDQVTSSTAGLALEVRAIEGIGYTIEFIGTRKGYDAESRPVEKDGKPVNATRLYSDDVGRVLKTISGPKAEYKFTGDEIYVRARVTSTRKHPNPSEIDEFERAWVQPVVGPAAMKPAD
jgi:hypothetical protein